MKKILSLLLAVPVSMALITGCSSDNRYQPPANVQNTPSNSPTPPPLSPGETDATLKELNNEMEDAIYTYLKEQSDYKINQEDIEKLISNEDQEYKKEILEFVDGLYRKVYHCNFQEPEPVQNEPDIYTVKVEIITKNFDGFNIETAIKNVSGIVDVDLVSEKLNLKEDMSEDDVYKVLFPDMLKEMKKSADDFFRYTKQNDPIPKTFKLTKVDEKWIAQEIQ